MLEVFFAWSSAAFWFASIGAESSPLYAVTGLAALSAIDLSNRLLPASLIHCGS
jgi:hypothetical protein